MSLFNYLDEQTNKNQSQDESFMGMGTLWEQMKKPVVEAGLLQSEPEPNPDPRPVQSYGSYDPDTFKGATHYADEGRAIGVASRGEGTLGKFFGYDDDFARSTAESKKQQFLENLGPSMGEMYKGLTHIATHPREFLGQMTDLVQGGLLHAGVIPESMFENDGRDEKEMASQMWDYIATTYGTWEGFKEHAIKNPAEFLLDLTGAGFTLRAGYRIGTSAAFKGKVHKIMDKVDALGRAITPQSVIPMTAWHGSPWRFRNFELKHMGKGEGAQAYGHGMYFAQNKKTGQTYVPHDVHYDDVLNTNYFKAKESGDALITDIYSFARSGDTPNDLRRYIDEAKEHIPAEDYTRAMAEIDKIADAYSGSPTSFLYKVDIPQSHIDSMINYDLPVWQQPEAVMKLLWKEEPHFMRAAEKYGKLDDRSKVITAELQSLHKQRLRDIAAEYEKTGKFPNSFDEGALDFIDKGDKYTTRIAKLKDEQLSIKAQKIELEATKGEGLPALEIGSGASIYDYLVERHVLRHGGDPLDGLATAEVSKWLGENGVKGIQFKDQLSRPHNLLGEAPDVTNNFLVFEEASVKTLARNDVSFADEGILGQVGAAQLLDKTDEVVEEGLLTGATVQMSSESLPSTDLLSGRMIKQMDIETQNLHQTQVNEAMGTFVEEKIGLEIVSDVNAPSSYDGHVGVSRQTRYKAEVDADGNLTPAFIQKIQDASAMYGQILDQDGVSAHYMVATQDISKATLGDINLGRVMTNDEMLKAQKIVDDSGHEFAVIASDDGVHILNFNNVDNDIFQSVSSKIGEALDADTLDFFDNGIGKAGYTGGFKHVTGQEDYQKIASAFGDTGEGGTNKSWGSHHDAVIEKQAEIKGLNEGFIKEHPLPVKTISEIGKETDVLAGSQFTGRQYLDADGNPLKDRSGNVIKPIGAGVVIDAKDYSAKANTIMSDRLYNESVKHLQRADKDARGWYTTKYDDAIDQLSEMHPELKNKVDADGNPINTTERKIFTALVSVLSDGSGLPNNMKNAVAAYTNWKKTGKLQAPSSYKEAYQTSLDKLQNLIDAKGLDEAMDFLTQTSKAGDIEKTWNVKTGYFVGEDVPNSTLLGPKVGMFYANLQGHPKWLTMDRWWNRSVNRLRGTMTYTPAKSSIDGYRKAKGLPDTMRDATVIKHAEKDYKIYVKSGFKDKTAVNQKANTLIKQTKELKDKPAGAGDRKFMMSIAQNAVERLRKNGYPDMTVADLQAIHWYGEKYRMKEKGSKAPLDVHAFDEVTKKMLSEKLPNHLLE